MYYKIPVVSPRIVQFFYWVFSGLYICLGEGDLVGFRVRVRAWEQAHLCQLGVEELPANLTHSSLAPLPKLPLIRTSELGELPSFFY